MFQVRKHHLISALVPDPYRGDTIRRLTKTDRILLPADEIEPCINFLYRLSLSDEAAKLVERIREHNFGIDKNCVVSFSKAHPVHSKLNPSFGNRWQTPLWTLVQTHLSEPWIPSGTRLQLLRYLLQSSRLQLKNRMIPPMTRYADALRDRHAICRGNPWPWLNQNNADNEKHCRYAVFMIALATVAMAYWYYEKEFQMAKMCLRYMRFRQQILWQT